MFLSFVYKYITLSPRRSYPFYMVTYYIKSVTTSWTDSKFFGNTYDFFNAYIPLSLSVSFSLYIYTSLSISISLSLYLALSIYFYILKSLYFSISLFLSIYLSLSISLSLSLIVILCWFRNMCSPNPKYTLNVNKCRHKIYTE